jgi:hypothetical protein
VGGSETDSGLFGGGTMPISVMPTDTAEPTPETPATVNPDDPSAANPLVECASAVATGLDSRIDDFESGSDQILEVDNRSGGWYDYDDDTTSAVQTIERLKSEGAPGGGLGGVLHVSSDGFPSYSGVGFGLRWTETGSEHCYYDASYYDGMRFWARGSGSVRLALQNPSVRPVSMGGTCPDDASCYDSHGYDFTLNTDWTEYSVSFSTLEQAGWGTPVGAFDPSKLFTVEFQFASGSGYDLWLDDVDFYKDGEPAPEPEPEPTTSAPTDTTPPDAAPPTPVFDAGVAAALDASLDGG